MNLICLERTHADIAPQTDCLSDFFLFFVYHVRIIARENTGKLTAIGLCPALVDTRNVMAISPMLKRSSAV